MPDFVAELNSLDFSNIIAGPILGAIDAQTAASMAQVQFIQEVGFKPGDNPGDPDKLRYVDFSYEKKVPNPTYDPTATTSPDDQPFLTENLILTVPLLTMISPNGLRIERMNVEFNARLSSTETASMSSSLGIDAELELNYKIVKFKASASYQRKTERASEVAKTYHLGVNVEVVNDELPEGLDRLLTILEDSIASVNAG